jgi:hypothetical protein
LSFWLLTKLDISDEMREECFDKMKLYNTAKEQIEFYENFYNNEKQIAKQCKKTIASYRKEVQEQTLVPPSTIEKIIGRDQLLREAFIDKLIEKLLSTREPNMVI